MDVFFSDEDRYEYLHEMAEQGERFGVDFLAWCLMINHIHLVAVPRDGKSLARAIGEAHKRYSRMINFREGSRGYLFQGRFFSCPVEPASLLAVVANVLRNPVRAGMVRDAWDHPWSSARWLVGEVSSDPLVRENGSLVEVDDWRLLLSSSDVEADQIRQHTRTGRPMGRKPFIKHLEILLGRRLQKKKPGPAPRK